MHFHNAVRKTTFKPETGLDSLGRHSPNQSPSPSRRHRIIINHDIQILTSRNGLSSPCPERRIYYLRAQNSAPHVRHLLAMYVHNSPIRN